MIEEIYTEYGSDLESEHELPSEPATASAATASEPNPKWHLRNSAQVFEAPFVLPEALIPHLQLARGRPMGIVGPPGAGKNDFAQAMALAIATGSPAFGLFPAKQGRIIHITWDMGDWATRVRYRRLANGMGLRRAQLQGKIDLAPYPELNLTSPGARRAFAELLSNYDLAILDNARAACPGLDENSSTFGERIVLFGQACEDAKCIGCYLHHSRKSNREREEEVTIESLRGTSAIAGASGAVWYIAPTAAPDSPRLCRMLRQHDVMPEVADDFYLHHVPCKLKGEFDTGDLNPINLIGSYDLAAPGTQNLHSSLMSILADGAAHSTKELLRLSGVRYEKLKSELQMLLDSGTLVELKQGAAKLYALAAKVQ